MNKECPCCRRKRVGPIRTWRRLSAYHHEPTNYITSCLHCIRNDDIWLKYDWHEYYSGQGYGQTHAEFMKELADQRGAKEYVKLIWYNQNYDVVEFRREYK